MAYISKIFADQLNEMLDGIAVSSNPNQRTELFSRMFNTPQPVAESLLKGDILPDDNLLKRLSDTFEVDTNWWLG